MTARAISSSIGRGRPVQFELTPAARDAVQAWIKLAGLKPEDFLFPADSTTRRIWEPPVRQRPWALGRRTRVEPRRLRDTLDAATKATLIYRRTKNLRAVQLLLGHSTLESTSGTSALT